MQTQRDAHAGSHSSTGRREEENKKIADLIGVLVASVYPWSARWWPFGNEREWWSMVSATPQVERM